jgi:perosamine synthetase
LIPLHRPITGPEEREAVARVLQSGHLAAGAEVAAFEAEFAAFVGVPEAVAVANGTAALWLGLWACGIGPGDEVIVPSFTFGATAGAVLQVGAVPVFADIDARSYCLTADSVTATIGPRTAAVIAVHLYGNPAPVDELGAVCRRAGLLFIEDAAQAHGARWQHAHVGGFGDFGAFSFYPTKNMTTGEGGMLTTMRSDLAQRARLVRNHGMDARYHHEILGTNMRMTDIAAAIGRVQLARLPSWVAQRQANAAWLDEHLADVVVTPWKHPNAEHAYSLYTIRSGDRSRLARALDDAGVGFDIYYPRGCHQQPAFGDSGESLPETERACAEVVSLPVRPTLTQDELATIAEAVRSGAA